MKTTSLLAVLVLGALPCAAAPPDVSALMTKGKLEADLGHHQLAARHFAAVAAAVPPSDARRWEALVRLGVAKRAAGEPAAAADAFERAWRDHGRDAAALRFLVEAVGGVVPGPERWAEIWSRVTLAVDRTDPRRPAVDVVWPGARSAREPRRYSGQPVALDFLDGNLNDVFRLFADISGLNVVVHKGVEGTVTFRAREVPWDAALERILVVSGLDSRLEGNVLRIGKPGQLGETATYSGQRADVTFRDQPMAEAFASFARLSGLEFEVDPAVTGRVTINLKDVPWDQALDLVVRTNGLRWTLDGRRVRVQLAGGAQTGPR
jgi:hypothetical protein